jgi:hypothetical protein
MQAEASEKQNRARWRRRLLRVMLRRRFWLIGSAVTIFAIDVALTLGGQPDDYWAGAHHTAVEGNPLVFPILACGPWVFVALAIVWGIGLVLVLGVVAALGVRLDRGAPRLRTCPWGQQLVGPVRTLGVGRSHRLPGRGCRDHLVELASGQASKRQCQLDRRA